MDDDITTSAGDQDSAQVGKRPIASYDQPTPEKKAFGERLRIARETAGIAQIDAANALGYSKGVQLSNMESGNRMPTMRVLMEATKLYGTTMDYLCGQIGDPSRDPAAATQCLVAAHVSTAVRGAIGALIKSSHEYVRSLRPAEAKAVRLASVALEVQSALERLRERSPEYDELPTGSMLLHKVLLLADLAADQLEDAARAHAAASMVVVPIRRAAAAFPLEELPSGHSLKALQPLDHASLEREDEDDLEQA